MTDYMSIDGLSGPVRTSPNVGAFECRGFKFESGSKAIYAKIDAGRSRPVLFGLCAKAQLINKIVANIVFNVNSPSQAIFFTGVIINRIFPLDQYADYSGVEMYLSYNSTSFQLANSSHFDKINMPFLRSTSFKSSTQRAGVGPMAIGLRRW